MDAFYRSDGDGFLPSELTRGPWDERAQHGGPPAGLIARAVEDAARSMGLPHVARLTLELLRPVPIARLSVRVSVDRHGRSAGRLSVELEGNERLAIRASALVLREAELDVEPSASVEAASPGPEDAPPFALPFSPTKIGYHSAMELRLARGEVGRTPTFVWMRSRVPLVEGEATSGLARVLTVADSGSGVGPALDWRRYSFINPDLTVALQRPADGEWIGLEARTTLEAERGVGLAHTRIHDLQGPLGYGIQSLLCAPRPA